MYITKMLIIPTRRYNPVFHRQLALNATYENVAMFKNVFEESNARWHNGVSEIAVAHNVPDLLTRTNTPTTMIEIANGWDTVRLRFLMEVVVPEAEQQEMVSYIQGYTEYHDPSMSGMVDPNMTWYINSIVNVRRSVNPATGVINTRAVGNYNIIYDHFNDTFSIDLDSVDNLVTVRPSDIINQLDNIYQYGQVEDDVQALDTRNNFKINPKLADRKHNLPVTHVTDTINKLNASKSIMDITTDFTDVLRDSAAMLSNKHLLAIPFIAAITNLSQSPTVKVSFTLNDLIALDPGVNERITMVTNDHNYATLDRPPSILDSEQTAGLESGNIETKIAVEVADSVSSLLSECMLQSITFTVTNLTMDSAPVLVPTDVKSFIDGLDIPAYTNIFIQKFNEIVMPTITQNSLIGVEIYVTADLLGDTTVAVGINGQPNVVYRLPTFADSLFAPVIADQYGVANLAEGYNELISNVIVN